MLLNQLCYASGGSKLNETARSYKQLFQKADTVVGVTFVWFTDGQGLINARHKFEENFDVTENIYNIDDLENGVIKNIMRVNVND